MHAAGPTPTSSRLLRVIAPVLLLLAAGCDDAAAPSGQGQLAVSVQPLTLDGVTGAVYDLAVERRDGDAWAPVVTVPGWGGQRDGSLTYIAPCAGGVDNRVTITLLEVLGPGGEPLDDVVLPPPATRTAACVANGDTAVTFDITVARAAQQGFLDVSVDVGDVFCSTKYDCLDAFIHDPATGARGPTLVTAVSCTAGPGQDGTVTLAGATLCCTDDAGQTDCFTEDATPAGALAAVQRSGDEAPLDGGYITLIWRLADAWLAANEAGVCRFQAVAWINEGVGAAYVEGGPIISWDVAVTRDGPADITCGSGSSVDVQYSRRALCEEVTVTTPGAGVASADLCDAGDDDVGAMCGASREDLVVAFDAPAAGTWRVTARGDGFDPTLSVRDACVGAETACAAGDGGVAEAFLTLDAGETAWIVVGYPGATCVSAPVTVDVTAQRCGDGVVDAAFGEVCDDGNDVDGDGCSSVCGAELPAGEVNLSTAPILPGRTCGAAVGYSVTGLTATTATVTPTPTGDCLAPGDEVVLLHAQGTSTSVENIGNFELLEVASVSGDVVTFEAAKVRYYGDGPDSDAGVGVGAAHQKVILQRVPNLGDAVVPSGTTLVSDRWSGLRGGVLMFRAAELLVDGVIDARRRGYGYGATSRDGPDCDDNVATERGESIDGPSFVTTATTWGAPGGLAALSNVGFNSTLHCNSTPGHATAGSPGRAANGRTPAAPGGSYGVANGSRLTMGSGANGHFSCWTGTGPTLEPRPDTERAGGIVAVLVDGALVVSETGRIYADGLGVPTGSRSASAGGYIRLEAAQLDLGVGRVSAVGGVAFNGAFTSPAGHGYVAVLYRDGVSGASEPPALTVDLTPSLAVPSRPASGRCPSNYSVVQLASPMGSARASSRTDVRGDR